MINIVITYTRFWGRWKKIYRISHPSAWNEVTTDQMLAIGRLMSGHMKEMHYLRAFLKAPRYVLKKLDPFHRYRLGNLPQFISETEALDYFIIPAFGKYLAPEPKLADITFAEFMHIDTFFIDYSENSSADTLQKFIACLYVKHVNGKRPQFTGRYNYEWAQKLKPWECQSLIINYSLLRCWLEKAFPEVFKKADTIKKKSNDNGWLDVFDGIVGDDIVHEDDYANKPAISTLRFLNRKIKESRKLRSKGKSLAKTPKPRKR
jgi:hypothetical protein